MKTEAFKKHEKIEEKHWWFKARREIIKSTLAKMEINQNPKILEVGSGTGGNLKMLSSFGDLTSVEISELAINISKIKTGNIVDIKSGSLPDNLPNFTHNFDLICLFDVLEHIKEDDRSLEKIYSLLNPNGFIFITVPAHQWLWSEIDELVEHVRRYSKKELKKKIFNAGFELKKISFFNFFLFPLAVLARLTSKLFKKQALGLSIPIKIINDCLYYIFSSEKRFLKRINFPLGLSLICVARKVS